MNIYVMPMPVLINGEVFYEGKDLSKEQFCEALISGKNVSTSQPSPADLIELWDRLFDEGYEQIVYIPMSSGLSGACESAKGYAMDYEGRVFVVDNHRISVTLYSAVLEAKKLADEGKNGEEIKAYLEKQPMIPPSILLLIH